MPSTLLDKYNLLFTDTYQDFMKKVRMAVVTVGQFQSDNGASPEAIAWGKDVLNQPDTWFQKMRLAILAHPTIANAASVESLTDINIMGVVETVAPGYFG